MFKYVLIERDDVALILRRAFYVSPVTFGFPLASRFKNVATRSPVFRSRESR